MSLSSIINLDEPYNNIFDFEYKWENVGDIDKEYLQKFFIDYWKYYEIVGETVDEFKYMLKRMWTTEIYTLNRLLKIQPAEYKLNTKTKIIESSGQGVADFSDTPNESMEDPNMFLTNRTKSNGTFTNKEEENDNNVEQFYRVSLKATDILSAFVKKFEKIFITDIIIKNERFNYDRF